MKTTAGEGNHTWLLRSGPQYAWISQTQVKSIGKETLYLYWTGTNSMQNNNYLNIVFGILNLPEMIQSIQEGRCRSHEGAKPCHMWTLSSLGFGYPRRSWSQFYMGPQGPLHLNGQET